MTRTAKPNATRGASPRRADRRPRSGVSPCVWLVAAACIAAPAGCQSSALTRKQEATERWNAVRAGFKGRLAADQLAAGRPRGAGEQISEAVRLDPNNAELALLSARIALAEGKLSTAMPLLERLSRAPSVRAEASYLLGAAWQQQKNWDAALSAYRTAADEKPDDVCYLLAVAQTLQQLKRPEEALALLRSHEARLGWTPAYHAAVAECLEQLGRFDEAALAWRKVSDGKAEDAAVQARLGIALWQCGRMPEAAELLADLARADGGAPDKESRALRLALADSLARCGRHAEARVQLALVLAETPGDALALRALARLQVEAGDFDGALASIRRALGSDPNDVGLLEMAAALAFRTGKHALADQLAQQITRLSDGKDSPVAQAILQSRKG
jgi:tetratricopeptide (TPR) repeat protein